MLARAFRAAVTPSVAARAAAVRCAVTPAACMPVRAFSVRTACRFAQQSNAATPAAQSARPSYTPSDADHTAATSSGARPSATAPSTTATEQTDAEAGLDTTVSSPAEKAKEAAAQEAVLKANPMAAGSGGGAGAGTGASAAADSSDSSAPKSPLGPASWTSVAFLIVVGGAAVLYYRYQQDKQQNTLRVETIGTPMLGGPFTLRDDSGRTVSSDSLKGQYVLLYFGFTHCPDICPLELKKMEAALGQYSSMLPAHPITPLFITIDPKRDTAARLREYKKGFMPAMRWLTGSDAEISAVAKAYRVYYSAPDVAEGSDEEYLVDHSIFFYLLDREGQFMEFFGKSKSAEEVALRMAQLVAQDNKPVDSK